MIVAGTRLGLPTLLVCRAAPQPRPAQLGNSLLHEVRARERGALVVRAKVHLARLVESQRDLLASWHALYYMKQLADFRGAVRGGFPGSYPGSYPGFGPAAPARLRASPAARQPGATGPSACSGPSLQPPTDVALPVCK